MFTGFCSYNKEQKTFKNEQKEKWDGDRKKISDQKTAGRSGTDVYKRQEFPVQILEMEHLITDQVTDREDRVRQRAAYETWDPQEVFDATIRKDLEEKFSYVYPYGYLQDIPAKVSVSELKKQGREEPEEETVYLYVEKEQEPIIPDFMKEEQEPLLQLSLIHI